MLLQRRAGILGQASAARQVRPARETAAFAGEQQAAGVRAGDLLDRPPHLVHGPAGQRVEPVGTRQRQSRHRRRALLQPDMFEVHPRVVA
jgi:hypothetical protein